MNNEHTYFTSMHCDTLAGQNLKKKMNTKTNKRSTSLNGKSAGDI